MKPGVFNPRVQSSVTQSKRSGRGGFYDEDEPKQDIKNSTKFESPCNPSNEVGLKETQSYRATTKPITPKFTM